MTSPDADFGDALRRALAAADQVETAEDALDRIRSRTRSRTPKQSLQAALAGLVPWSVFRMLGYRTMATDVMREWWGHAAAGACRATAIARRGYVWCAVRVKPVVELAWPDSAPARYGRAAARRGRALARRVLLDDRVTALARLGGDLVRRGYRHAVARGGHAVRRGRDLAAPVLRRWFAAARRAVTRTGQQFAQSPALPRHAETRARAEHIDWIKPAVTAASIAFVVTLSMTVPTVRQAIVQIGSTVITTSQGTDGGDASTLTTGGQPAGSGWAGKHPGSARRSHHGTAPSPGHRNRPTPCQTNTATPSPANTKPPPRCVSSEPTASSSPTSSPSPSASPSPSPSPSATPTPSPSPSPSASVGNAGTPPSTS